MRTINIALLAFIAVFVASGSAFAIVDDSDIHYLDFTGWDDALISGTGQTFANLYAGSVVGLVDVTVQQVGGSPSFAGGGKVHIERGEPGSQDFLFSFSKPLRFIVHHRTTDLNEDVSLATTSAVGYTQIDGSSIVQTSIPDGLRVDGQAYGIPPTGGAAEGQFRVLGGASGATYTYGSVVGFPKYDTFRVGVLVPEPNTSALIGIGLLGMAMSFRRRNK